MFGIVSGPVLSLGATAFVWLLSLVNRRRVRGNWVLVGPLVAFVILALFAIPYRSC